MIDFEYYRKLFPGLRWDKKLQLFGDITTKYNCIAHTVNVD